MLAEYPSQGNLKGINKLTMKATTIEKLRKEFCEIYKMEYIPLMSNILFLYVQHLEQKLIQSEQYE
jgi:hypothetical protein